MRIKQNLEEYIKKEEVEKIYDYQKKSFETKIEDLQSNISKIEDCLSLRFGEDIKNNKYDIELEEIKKKLDDLIHNSIDDKKMKSELSKIAFDIQIEMDRKINSEKEELEKFSNEVIEELNSVIESTKKREENLAQDSQKYIEELKVKLDDIAKDGRSRTAIGKQEKTIKAMEASRKEIYTEIENTKNLIDNKIEKLNYNETIKDINNYIKKIEEDNFLDYEENKKNIENLKTSLFDEIKNQINELKFENRINEIKQEIKDNVEETENCLEFNENKIQLLENTFNSELNKKQEQIEDIKVLINELEQKQQEDQIQNLEKQKEKIENIKEIINKLEQEYQVEQSQNAVKQQEQIESIKEIINKLEQKQQEEKLQNEEKQKEQEAQIAENINNIENKIEQKIIENRNEIKISTKNNIKEEIEKLNYTSTIEDLQNKVNEEKQNKQEQIENIKEIINKLEQEHQVEQSQNAVKQQEQIESIKEIINKLEQKQQEEKLQNEEKQKEQEAQIAESINNIENKIEQKIIENRSEIESNTKNNIKEEIEKLNYTSTIEELKNNILNLQDQIKVLENSNNKKMQEINKKFEEINIKEMKDEISNNLKVINGFDKQIQAVLDIVLNLEDKYNNINSFSELQEKEIEKIINKKMKTMETKYNKLIESKLKLIDSNIKAQEKIQKNKEEIKKKSTSSKTKQTTRKKKETTTSNNTIYEIPVVEENKKDNIYSEIEVEEKISAEPVYNPSLEEMLKKLKSAQIGNSNLEKSVNNINKILGYTNKDAEN